ncbi:MAG: DUF1311 domain-containing protein [Lysobacteraceae bacterium]|nr:MAG: DUF1311 domain-containing protein [Xanthomonadaceae bacterium]
MKATVHRVVHWGARAGFCLLATSAMAQSGPIQAHHNPNLQRHWDQRFDVTLPKGVASDDLKGRCWSQPALESYVLNGRFWIEDIYGLPYGYVDSHCLREELSKMNSSLNASYKVLLRSLAANRRQTITASERRWVVQRNRECNVPDGVSYVMLGSFVCLMNMTNDRLNWITSRQRSLVARWLRTNVYVV